MLDDFRLSSTRIHVGLPGFNKCLDRWHLLENFSMSVSSTLYLSVCTRNPFVTLVIFPRTKAEMSLLNFNFDIYHLLSITSYFRPLFGYEYDMYYWIGKWGRFAALYLSEHLTSKASFRSFPPFPSVLVFFNVTLTSVSPRRFGSPRLMWSSRLHPIIGADLGKFPSSFPTPDEHVRGHSAAFDSRIQASVVVSPCYHPILWF